MGIRESSSPSEKSLDSCFHRNDTTSGFPIPSASLPSVNLGINGTGRSGMTGRDVGAWIAISEEKGGVPRGVGDCRERAWAKGKCKLSF